MCDKQAQLIRCIQQLASLTVVPTPTLQLLKTFAFGCSFYRNSWNTFDAIVIVVSLIMGIVEAFLSSLVILRILRLRSVLRLFRLMVLVGKVKQTHDTLHTLRVRHNAPCQPTALPTRLLAPTTAHTLTPLTH